MKINYTKWDRTYSTPYITVINSDTYIQVSFVVLCYHWWIIINKNK